VDAGAVVVEILSTRLINQRATQTDLDAWVNAVGITVTSVVDPEGLDLQTLNAMGIRESLVIVELPSMTVVHYDPGDQSGTVDPSVVAGLNKLYELLGQQAP
jgi:hypothetical protein